MMTQPKSIALNPPANTTANILQSTRSGRYIPKADQQSSFPSGPPSLHTSRHLCLTKFSVLNNNLVHHRTTSFVRDSRT